ncbi:MAG TPA: GGDEF domain-containing protein [Candidatus Sulfotelmatobacter sp.]|nr:GGDEF domain-containing protein [Candidatus Sulfotelmatobacter sp.]
MTLTRSRMLVAAAAMLWLAHVGVCLSLGTKSPGPFLSDLIQLVIGGLLIASMLFAAERSEGMVRAFWRLGISAYTLLMMAQGLSVYNDLARTPIVSWVTNLLFCFWFAPLAMALFLDPEHDTGRIDAILVLDFIQAMMVCVTAYVYFFYLPKSEATGEMARGVWAPYFAGYGLVALAFVLRSILTRSRDVRVLFGSMGLFLAFSGCVDALYEYGPGKNLSTGQWFDLLWSFLLIVPMAIATAWKQVEAPVILLEPPKHEKRIYAEISYLLYPALVLIMSLRIAQQRLTLAGLVVLLSFISSSARMLVTQNQLMKTREALRREAKRDSLTNLWNHKAILEILERELLRSERDHEPVGVIMVDVDHFKDVNDSHGHAAGDTVLRIIASGIAAMVRPYDSVGRYGGEEFLIIAPGCRLGETWELAERVRAHVARCSIMAAGTAVHVTLSLGVATGECAADLEKVLGGADAAMYRAKAAGRNRVEPSQGRAAGAGQGGAATSEHDFWI